ncbi:MAG: sigma-54-dependent Fis family transcriptional regulator [Pelagibacterales bacterium]|nr:sigma-54-dependent Fis family transcriptional regulator [Pelagibacterales bacterium]
MTSEILLIDDEKDIRFAVHEILKENNFFVREADTVEKALSEIKKKLPDLVILDVLLDEKNRDGIHILKFIKSLDADLPVIMISGHANIQIAVDSIKHGAFEFLEKPFNKDRLLNFVNRALENSSLKKENKSLKKNLYLSNELIGNSSTLIKLRNSIEKFSKTDSRILIFGPAGSGKELVGRLIHEASSRSNNSFKVVNGAILDPNHFDFELFGSENNDKIISGIFEKTNNGTLLIDNISDVPLQTQGKILRVLSDQKFHRVNGANEISVNIRVMCSTSKNLKEEIESGNFREDLFHRINVIPIQTPYLKDVKEDIPLLVDYFIKRISDTNGLKTIVINSKNAVFYDYDWPGNVRELRNLIERVVILASGKNEDVDKILSESLKISSVRESKTEDAFQFPLKEAREKFEKNYLEIQLNRHNGNVSKTADYIGMERSALHRKLKSLGIN